jgi:queuine/archaeosine tRNA-ribosyltransferase
MKFIFADSMDFVDPGYDFLRDRNAEGRAPYWDDVYPHQLLEAAPYDGVLVSRGIVGGAAVAGKYSEAQAMRFRRVGARAFLRLDTPELQHLPIFGDCGAFTYAKEEVPPYTPEDMLDFYADGDFTHGCSVDHIIFDFDLDAPASGGTADARRRFDITLENADSFLRASRSMGSAFTPLGVVQGWSPASMAEAARRLVAMGYDYLAIGGTVPLKTPQIKACLEAVRAVVPHDTRIHILGFAKADDISGFGSYRITSFDTTSPLLRAFKDARQNYYLKNPDGRLSYYTAIRVPQALENTKLIRLAKRGALNQEALVKLERAALDSLRRFDRDEAGIDETLDVVLAYAAPALLGATIEDLPGSNDLKQLEERYRRTLEERPWKACGCEVCEKLGIEVIIFRASNRNKRRGIHNLQVFKTLIDSITSSTHGSGHAGHFDLLSASGEPEQHAHGALAGGQGLRPQALCGH